MSGQRELEEGIERIRIEASEQEKQKQIDRKCAESAANKREQYKLAIFSSLFAGLFGGLFGALFAWLFSSLH